MESSVLRSRCPDSIDRSEGLNQAVMCASRAFIPKYGVGRRSGTETGGDRMHHGNTVLCPDSDLLDPRYRQTSSINFALYISGNCQCHCNPPYCGQWHTDMPASHPDNSIFPRITLYGLDWMITLLAMLLNITTANRDRRRRKQTTAVTGWVCDTSAASFPEDHDILRIGGVNDTTPARIRAAIPHRHVTYGNTACSSPTGPGHLPPFFSSP